MERKIYDLLNLTISNYGEYQNATSKFYLKQYPYIDSDCDRHTYYRACAIDDQGFECDLYWSLIEEVNLIDDQIEACDWDQFTVKY